MAARPFYETPANQMDESIIIKRVQDAYKCHIVKTPRAYPIDCAVYIEGHLAAWLELKTRNTEYDTLMLSLQKIVSAVNYAVVTTKPFWLAVRYRDTDEIKRVKLYPRDKVIYRDIQLAGRQDRNDPQDVEPCAMIAKQYFEKVKSPIVPLPDNWDFWR